MTHALLVLTCDACYAKFMSHVHSQEETDRQWEAWAMMHRLPRGQMTTVVTT